jgi:hypothetical protein
MPCLINIPKSNADFFSDHLEKYGLIGFGGYKIKTKYDKGKLVKTLGIGIKEWAKVINPENYKEFIMSKWTDKETGKETFSQPQSYYIKTGKRCRNGRY